MEKRQLLIEKAEEEIIEKIKKSETKDDKIVKIVEKMKNAGVRVLKNDEWHIKNKLIFKKRKMYIPKNKSLRLEIIQLHHNILIAGYREQQKIVELVTRNY